MDHQLLTTTVEVSTNAMTDHSDLESTAVAHQSPRPIINRSDPTLTSSSDREDDDQDESAVAAVGPASSGATTTTTAAGGRNSLTLFVYEPKTGRTNTKLFLGGSGGHSSTNNLVDGRSRRHSSSTNNHHPAHQTHHRSSSSTSSSSSLREKCLCTYSTVTTFALAFLIAYLFLNHIRVFPREGGGRGGGITSSVGEEICMTKECMITASRMLQKLNTSIEPCEDFYEYACGAWNARAHPPPGYIFWSTLNELTYSAFDTMKNEYTTPTFHHSEAERKAGAIFNSCMDTEMASRLGAEPLRQFLDTLGGWSLLNPQKNYSNWSLDEELNRVFSYGFLPIIWISVVMDDRNTSRHVIGLDQAQVVLRGREQYLDLETGTRLLHTNETPLVQLRQWVAYTGVLLGADPRIADERAHRIVEFESRLAYTIPPKKFIPSLYHATTLRNLTKHATMLDWPRFLNTMFDQYRDPTTRMRTTAASLDPDEPILVYGWEWLTHLDELLREYMETEEGRRTIDDYIKWYVAFRLTPSLDRSLFNDSVQPLFNLLLGLITSPPRWLECAMQTEAMMSLAASSIYVKLRPNGADVRRQASDLVERMTAEIRHHLVNVTWMDEPTKQRALKKVENIVPMVGYSDELLNSTYLDKLYETLHISDSEYFDNTVAAFGLARKTALGLLRKKPSRRNWDASTAPVNVNAYYGFPLNRIIFPLAILQSPVFDGNGPETINYAMIGSIIGHELVHAFDDTGKEYDDGGNLNRWWSSRVYETSAKRGQCLVQQYNNYTYEGMQLDGARTLNENVADFDGLNIAYNAFRRSTKTRPHRVLPGLNMTSEQLFFVSYAQLWCSKAAQPQFRRLQITADMHSVEKYRVIGPLSNFRPFSRLYECSLGSTMNPHQKCNVH